MKMKKTIQSISDTQATINFVKLKILSYFHENDHVTKFDWTTKNGLSLQGNQANPYRLREMELVACATEVQIDKVSDNYL